MSIWLLPIVAALLGYCTNKIAVWMLFHPRRVVRVFNRRLLGPGVIPREQGRIAEQRGETVTTELLRAEDLQAVIAQEEVPEWL